MATARTETKTTVADVEVIRKGTQIILPPKMEYDEAINWLMRKRDADESEVNVHYPMKCSALDGAVAFQRAIAHRYGWSELVPTPGFWGDTPPTMVAVPVSHRDTIQVPWGNVKVPSIWGTLSTGFGSEIFIIGGKTKRKHEQEVKELYDLTVKFQREQSIYKGKAIKVSWEWEREGKSYHPLNNAPQFISLEGTSENDLVFGKDVENALRIGLFTPIEQAEACRRFQVPLKRGILLYGAFGTGKTLTANVTALKAVRHGFTFVYLDSVLDLKRGLQFAAQYAPAVVFAEDVDRVTDGDRSLSMDEVLNTLDGVDTKGAEIITVFTTNHVEKINPAILRMGRLDTLVEVKRPDAEAAQRLVEKYARGLLDPDVNLTRVGEVLKSKIPAFIRETTERAKIAAISRLNGGDILGQVLEDDLLQAASAMEPHAALLEPKNDKAKKAPEMLVRVPQGHGKVAERLISALKSNGDDEEDDCDE